MRNLRFRCVPFLIAAACAAPISLVATTAHAAGQPVTWDGSNMFATVPRQNVVVGCSATGVVTFNSVATVPEVECRFVRSLGVFTTVGTNRFTIDMRPVKPAQFSALASTGASLTGGPATYYGSSISDTVTLDTGSIVYGFGGGDVMYGYGIDNQMWGGAGNAALRHSRGRELAWRAVRATM